MNPLPNSVKRSQRLKDLRDDRVFSLLFCQKIIFLVIVNCFSQDLPASVSQLTLSSVKRTYGRTGKKPTLLVTETIRR